jgi:hypothetical protein
VTAQAWYQPTDRGVEARIAERLAELRRMNAAALPERPPREAK